MSFTENTAKDAFSITPGAAELTKQAQALYIGGAGDVTVTTAEGTSVTFSGVVAGSILPITVTKVTAATATLILGLSA